MERRAYLDAPDRSELRKHLSERVLGDVLRQTPDVNVGRERVAGVVRSCQDGGVFAGCAEA